MPGKPLHSEVRFWRDELLPGVEARFSAYRHKAFRTHLHAEYSVGLIEHGSTRFTLAGVEHQAHAGDIVLINPEEPHACNPDTENGITYRMFYIAPTWLAQASTTDSPLRFTGPVVHNPSLFTAWWDLHESFIWGAAASTKKELLSNCLHQLLCHFSEQPTPPKPSISPAEPRPAPHAPASAVNRARAHLASSVGNWVPLTDLAQVAGLSPHHFARTFKASTGLPPHAYQIQLALEHAKHLLNQGLPISQAALDAGFTDQSHFSRCFRQFTGATPRQYVLNKPCENDPKHSVS